MRWSAAKTEKKIQLCICETHENKIELYLISLHNQFPVEVQVKRSDEVELLEPRSKRECWFTSRRNIPLPKLSEHMLLYTPA